MKKLYIVLLVVLSTYSMQAQNTDVSNEGTIELNELEVNNAPSLMLLDEAPTTMDRKNGGSAFAFSQFNGSNYAASITPFWYFKRRNKSAIRYAGVLTRDKKGDEDGRQFRMNPIAGWKLITLSGAFVTQNHPELDLPVSTFSAGGHLNILSIYPKGTADNIVARNNDIARVFSDKYAVVNNKYSTKLWTFFLKEYFPGKTIETLNFQERKQIKSSVKRAVDSIYHYHLQQEIDEAIDGDVDTLITQVNERPLFSLDGAVGVSTFYLDNDYSKNRFGKLGAWLTAIGSIPLGKSIGLDQKTDGYINFYALGRYLDDRQVVNDIGFFEQQTYFDFGGKVEIEVNKLSIGYEYVGREGRTNTYSTFRSNAVVQYKLTPNLYLTGAYGKNFGDAKNLLALFGLNWSFLKEKQDISISASE